ncbi:MULTISPECIES: hypothetical protein [Streptomyces]|nr:MULTISPECIES: hypothetical protein [Streptomyces]WUB41088.1 hypothetical protein OHN38_41655 [Streptomyces sp. NBC_00588]
MTAALPRMLAELGTARLGVRPRSRSGAPSALPVKGDRVDS